MRCPVASCMKDVEPAGFPSGVQELLAMRIHLARDHGIFRNMIQVMELRCDEESVEAETKGIVRVDVDANEKWLEATM